MCLNLKKTAKDLLSKQFEGAGPAHSYEQDCAKEMPGFDDNQYFDYGPLCKSSAAL